MYKKAMYDSSILLLCNYCVIRYMHLRPPKCFATDISLSYRFPSYREKARLQGNIFLSSCIIEKAEKERRMPGFVRLHSSIKTFYVISYSITMLVYNHGHPTTKKSSMEIAFLMAVTRRLFGKVRRRSLAVVAPSRHHSRSISADLPGHSCMRT